MVECLRVMMVRPPLFNESSADLARQAEDMGWHGAFIGDSQHLHPEAWLTIGLAIGATSTLKLALGVTNADTRDPAVTASAAAGAQWYSGGRFILGIGRGDSAVHKLGRMPVGLEGFEEYITKVQRYLRGEPANEDTDGAPSPIWASKVEMAKPPVNVSATGPKVIALGARVAEQVSFSVGADPNRIKWAVEHARGARRESGGDPDTLALGAYVVVIVTDDLDQGRSLARGLAAVHLRFNAMNTNKALEHLTGTELEMATKVSAAYKASGHGFAESDQAKVLDDEFIDRYAIVGPAGYCVERLTALAELGITRFWVLPPGIDTDPAHTRTMYDRFAGEVLPRLL